MNQKLLWIQKGIICLIACLSLISITQITTYAASTDTEDIGEMEEQKQAIADLENDYLTEIESELDFSNLDVFASENLPQKYKFTDLITDMIDHKDSPLSLGAIGKYVLDLFFFELDSAKPVFVEIILLSILFAITSKIYVAKNNYVNDVSFLVIYGTLMILLMQSFLLVKDIVTESMELVIEFMQMLIPAYATTVCLSGCMTSATVFYEMTFSVMVILEWIMNTFLVPGIHVFVLLEFLDHLYEEEKLSRFADLIESGIKFILKITIGCVVGLGTVQNFIASAEDRISGNSAIKIISMVPGIGNVLDSTGELLLGCGMLVKNSVGIAGVILLFLLCLTPLIKVFCFQLFYRFTGALLQPVCDKRMVDCIQGVARGSSLYFSVMLDGMILFMITIAMVTASTSFVF